MPASEFPPSACSRGRAFSRRRPHIRTLVRATSSASILDYGSGKGRQYDLRRIVDDEGELSRERVRRVLDLVFSRFSLTSGDESNFGVDPDKPTEE